MESPPKPCSSPCARALAVTKPPNISRRVFQISYDSIAEAVKQLAFQVLESVAGNCDRLAEALGIREDTRMSVDEARPANQPPEPNQSKPSTSKPSKLASTKSSKLATAKPSKRKARTRDATSPPPVRPPKRPRQEAKPKSQPNTAVFDAVVIETRPPRPPPKYNLELTRFMDKYEIESRKYYTALLDFEDRLREKGL